ncbi:MAG TPA: hypothetical protein VFZ02_09220, partial [Ktedonobacteraceae bacterium]
DGRDVHKPENGILREKTRGCDVVGWRTHMQRKARFYRVQLLAYDLIDAPLWSLPLIGPSPTPMPLDEPSLRITRPRLRAGVVSLHPVPLPRRIHLLRTGD